MTQEVSTPREIPRELLERLTRPCRHCPGMQELVKALVQQRPDGVHFLAAVDHVAHGNHSNVTGELRPATLTVVCNHCHGTGHELTAEGERLLWFLHWFYADSTPGNTPTRPPERDAGEIPF